MPHPAPAHKSFSDRTTLYQEITDKIVAELEQGRVPWVQPWAGAPAPLGLPKNAATGRSYSGINILILWLARTERGFTGQSWLTFRQALKLGAHVRKGERGITVVYADRFIPYREHTRAAETGDEPDAIPFLKRFTVFNADQCEDLPADIAPPPEPLAENLILPQAEALITATGADIRIGGDRAFYVPTADYIQVPPPAAFFRADQFSPDGLSRIGSLEWRCASSEPRPLRQLRLIGVCARRVGRGNHRRLCLRGAVDRADGTPCRLSRLLARSLARGQSGDHPRRERRIEGGRLSARLRRRRSCPRGSR
jgi:antirestriction protein ArdC